MIWIETKTLHSLSACHGLCLTFQVDWVKNETAAESSCGCLTMTLLYLLFVFCSVASLTELDLLKMTWLTGNSWQITRLLMHRGREWQFKSESCLRLETWWGLNEGFFPPVFLCTCKWRGVVNWSMQRSENMPHDGYPCQRKQLCHCLTNILTTKQNVYPKFQSTFQQMLLNTCGILRCFQNKPTSPKERTPPLLYCLEDGPGQNFWTLLYHAEYLWHLPKNKNFYEIMSQGDKQYISTVKVLLKNKGSLWRTL